VSKAENFFAVRQAKREIPRREYFSLSWRPLSVRKDLKGELAAPLRCRLRGFTLFYPPPPRLKASAPPPLAPLGQKGEARREVGITVWLTFGRYDSVGISIPLFSNQGTNGSAGKKKKRNSGRNRNRYKRR